MRTETMKKAIITAKREVALKEVPVPKAVKDWALVKIMSAPMCTEYKDYRDGIKNDFLGHEAAGIVTETATPCSVKPGDRVVVMPQYPCGSCSLCQSGDYIHCEHNYDFDRFTGSPEGKSTYAQYLLKPAWLLPKIPDGISCDHASMLCCGLGPTFGAMELMKVSSSDTVLITGMGPVGLGGVINGVSRGCRVIAVTHHKYRADLAKSLGAAVVFDYHDPDILNNIIDFTEGNGADAAIDCAGNKSSQRLCLDATKRLGQVSFVGESGFLNINISDDLIRNGLTLHGVWHYNLKYIPELFRIVRDHKDIIEKLITHTFPMSRVNEAFELQLTRQCGKVILKPWERNSD
ncbi:zinc-binding dehydrogenase [bacterium]|nr:zinc-binding dehydrogenase [bacterium]